jgi:fructosamine-3-kinase
METMSAAVSEALGKKVELVSTSGGGGSGGGGVTTSAVMDKISGTKYFVKAAQNKFDMLMAKYVGVKAMADTNTIQVPTPIAFGQHKTTGQAFCMFEHLEFCGGGNQFELGVQLAKVRR